MGLGLGVLGRLGAADLFSFETADGRGLRNALAFLAPYAAGDEPWPWKQIQPFPRDVYTPISWQLTMVRVQRCLVQRCWRAKRLWQPCAR